MGHAKKPTTIILLNICSNKIVLKIYCYIYSSGNNRINAYMRLLRPWQHVQDLWKFQKDSWHKDPSQAKKFFPVDPCWERKIQFSPLECQWVCQPHSMTDSMLRPKQSGFHGVFFFWCFFYLVWFEYFLSFCCYLFVLIFVQFLTEREKEQETGWIGRVERYGRSCEGKEYNQNIFYEK